MDADGWRLPGRHFAEEVPNQHRLGPWLVGDFAFHPRPSSSICGYSAEGFAADQTQIRNTRAAAPGHLRLSASICGQNRWRQSFAKFAVGRSAAKQTSSHMHDKLKPVKTNSRANRTDKNGYAAMGH